MAEEVKEVKATKTTTKSKRAGKDNNQLVVSCPRDTEEVIFLHVDESIVILAVPVTGKEITKSGKSIARWVSGGFITVPGLDNATLSGGIWQKIVDPEKEKAKAEKARIKAEVAALKARLKALA